MDDKETTESLSEEEAARKLNARLRGMAIVLAIFAVPVFIGGYLVVKMKRSLHRERAWAEAEMLKASPDPRAYGSLGAALLNEKKAAEAVKLLEKAAAIEAGQGVSALVLLIEARAEAGDRAGAMKDLEELAKRAPKLPQGPQAAAFHAAGKLYMHLGERGLARACLKKAMELQPDDWVEEGPGRRYKQRGIASIYARDFAGAEMQGGKP